MGKLDTLGNRDCQWASRSVLKDFIEGAVTISVGSLFQNGTGELATARTASLLVELIGVARSPLRIGCAKVDTMGNSKRPCVKLEQPTNERFTDFLTFSYQPNKLNLRFVFES